MYIPSTFFSSQGSCISASASSIAGNGLITSGIFLSGSVLYQYYQFETQDYSSTAYPAFTASLNILSGTTGQAKILIVAAGGTGGRPQQYFTPQGSSISYQSGYSGGGGGGGVVYYNNFPLSSGSYEIGVANANPAPNSASGSQGSNSYIKLPNNIIYTPFNTSYLIAEGGGAGGTYGLYQQLSPRRDFYYSLGPGNGGSAGGAGSNIAGDAQGGVGSPNPNGGLNGQVQGYRGGLASGVDATTGGGGAGGIGVDGNKTNGGPGVTYNLNGTPTIYGKGGGGASLSAGLTYGGGGSAGTYVPFTTFNYGTPGYGGIVIITWPICLADSDNCRDYVIRGGGSGGTMTYFPCDSQTLTTTTIDSAYEGSACLYKIAGYPTTTGTVTLTETGSCNTFIQIAPTVTCETGVKTPVNVYDYSLSGQCYPSTSSCQRTYYPTQTINYVDVNAASQSISVGGWTGTGQICARTQPTPTITGGTITNSGLICGFYCSGSINTTIQDCATSVTKSVSFLTSSYIPIVGNVIKTFNAGLSGSCWNVIETGTTQPLDYSNVSIFASHSSCPECTPTTSSLLVNYLIVAGGGAGGSGNGDIGAGGGGGGAGGYISNTIELFTSQSYSIIVGAGGIGDSNKGTNGNNSSAFTYTAIGGGAGGAFKDENGNTGGSGGGGHWGGLGGSGTALQGNNGGSGSALQSLSGGGGGALAAGSPGPTTSNGGSGSVWVDGIRYAGGGGGWRRVASLQSSNGLGGPGGGGVGGQNEAVNLTTLRLSTSGSVNTGGGGGGSWNSTNGGDGGSGIVKIRYAGSGSKATGGTISYSGSYTYHTFTSSGDFITN